MIYHKRHEDKGTVSVVWKHAEWWPHASDRSQKRSLCTYRRQVWAEKWAKRVKLIIAIDDLPQTSVLKHSVALLFPWISMSVHRAPFARSECNCPAPWLFAPASIGVIGLRNLRWPWAYHLFKMFVRSILVSSACVLIISSPNLKMPVFWPFSPFPATAVGIPHSLISTTALCWRLPNTYIH